MVVSTPTRPDVAFVFLPAKTALATCVVPAAGAGGLLLRIDPTGESPSADSISVWGAGSQFGPAELGGPSTTHVYGRAGADVAGISVVIGSLTTEGVIQDGWFLVEAPVIDPGFFAAGFLEWTLRDASTRSDSLADLLPDNVSSATGVVIDTSEGTILAAMSTWINQLGLAETDTNLWRQRLQRACNAGVWNKDVGLSLAAEFITADLDKSVRSQNRGGPTARQGASALWIMAAQVCPDAFPPQALADGPPSP